MKREVLCVLTGVLFCNVVLGGESVSITRIVEENGMLVATVENRYSSPVTGLLVEATMYSNGKPKLKAVRYLDVYVNAFHDKALQTGEQRPFPLVAADLAQKSPPTIAVTAALFADGSRFGTSDGIRILSGRRRAAITAIERFRDALLSKRGGDLLAVRAFVEELRLHQETEFQALRRDEMPIAAVASQVGDWVRGSFDGAPSQCGIDCAARRVEYILGGLERWQGEINKGLRELALP